MKILLTGNTFHGYDEDLLNGLKELGHEVDFLFNNIHGPFNNINQTHLKWMYGVLPSKFNVNYFKNKSIATYNQHLLKLIKANDYQLVLFIGAKTVFEETLTAIKIPKVLWFMDGVKYYTDLHEKFKLFDHLFLFEPTDKELLTFLPSSNISILHLGFSTKRFYPLSSTKKFDFSFVGSFYPNRDEILKPIVDTFSNGVIYGDFKKSKYDAIKKLNQKAQISIAATNMLFNASKCNINIHHPQSIAGLNVRTFEILGSGNLQFVERKKVASTFFKDDQEIVFYDSKEELKDKMNYYLNHEDQAQKISIEGYQKAISQHTWKHRLEELLTTISHKI